MKLPRMLDQAVGSGMVHEVEGPTVRDALNDLFRREPGLRGHLIDESGSLRPHVSVFVDGTQAGLDSPVADGASIRILHAVSGGI